MSDTTAIRSRMPVGDASTSRLASGKMVAVVPAEHANAAVDAMRSCETGKEARVVGEITEDHPRLVLVRTASGAPESSTWATAARGSADGTATRLVALLSWSMALSTGTRLVR